MLYAILVAVALVCAFGWLNRCVCCVTLIMYMQGKGYTLPTEEESKACLTEAWSRLLGIKR